MKERRELRGKKSLEMRQKRAETKREPSSEGLLQGRPSVRRKADVPRSPRIKKGNSSFAIPFSFRPIVLTQTMFYYMRSGGSVRNLYIVHSWCGVHVSDMENIVAVLYVHRHSVDWASTGISDG